MKPLRLLALILPVAVIALSCSSKPKREKITDPVQQEALRTRDQAIPVDSLFTSSSVKKVLSPFDRIAMGEYVREFKTVYREESRDKVLRTNYADYLRKEEKLDKEKAEKKAEKADSAALSVVDASFLERVVYTEQNLPAATYSPSLTLYFMIVLILFVILFTVRVIRAFFISPKKM